MRYTMRNEQGVMVCKFGGRTALFIFENATGHWKDSAGGGRVFIVDEDSIMVLNKELRLFIWKGTTIYKDEE